MKAKLLSLFMTATVSLSFSSCDNDSDVDQSEFQLPKQVITQTTPDGNPNNVYTQSMGYGYDTGNRLTEIVFKYSSFNGETNRKVTISYAADNRVEQYSVLPLDLADSRGLMIYTVSYSGNTIEIHNSGFLMERITLDHEGRIAKREQSNTPVIVTTTYDYYDGNNAIHRMHESYPQQKSTSYSYDNNSKGMFWAVETPQWLLVVLTDITDSYTCSPRQRSEGLNGNTILVSGSYNIEYNKGGYPTSQTYTPIDSRYGSNTVIRTTEYGAAN